MCMVLCNLQVLWTRSGWLPPPLHLSCWLIQPGTDFWMVSLDSLPEPRHAWWPHHVHFLYFYIKKKKKKKGNISEIQVVVWKIMDESGFIVICFGILLYVRDSRTKSWSWQAPPESGWPWGWEKFPGRRVCNWRFLFDSTCQGNVPHWTVSWLNWFLSCLMIHIALCYCWSYSFIFCFICPFFPDFICLCTAKSSHFLFQFTFRGSSMETPVR